MQALASLEGFGCEQALYVTTWCCYFFNIIANILHLNLEKFTKPLSAAIMLTLEVQGSLDPKAPLKEFVQALRHQEKFQQRVAEIKGEVEAFAGQFPMPGLPEL